jgi:hypothetical protein
VAGEVVRSDVGFGFHNHAAQLLFAYFADQKLAQEILGYCYCFTLKE